MSENSPFHQLLVFAMDGQIDGEHIQNNNNQNNLWQLRDRLFQVLFERATIAYSNAFPYRLRKLVEFSFLFFAVTSLLTLAYIHMAFVQKPVDCLEEETKTWSREGVLRVEISLEEPGGSIHISKYCNNQPPPVKHIPKMPEKFILPPKKKNITTPPPVPKVEKISAVVDNKKIDIILDEEKRPQFINRTLPFKDGVSDPDCLSPLRTTLSDMEMFSNAVWPQEEYVVEYSLEYGFLRLSSSARHNTSVKVHTVTLDPLKDRCFGNHFSQSLLKYVVGYSDVLMSSLRYLVDKDDTKGFVRNVVTGDQYRFVDKSTTWTSYFSAAFIMMVFTLSISMLLRYSHHQIFMFIVELLHVFELNTSVSFPAAPLLTVVLALVGMEAIMSEFFNDSTTAFYIILIVWIADQYDTICCHTPLTKYYWLRFFYLYHFAFYAYHYRFNGQYSSLALACSWLFIQHSMLFFFHRYELPAVLHTYAPQMENSDDALPPIENPMHDFNLLDQDSTQREDIVQHDTLENSNRHTDPTLPQSDANSTPSSDDTHSDSDVTQDVSNDVIREDTSPCDAPDDLTLKQSKDDDEQSGNLRLQSHNVTL